MLSHYCIPGWYRKKKCTYTCRLYSITLKLRDVIKLPYASEAKFWSNMVQALRSDHLGLTFCVVAFGRFDCIWCSVVIISIASLRRKVRLENFRKLLSTLFSASLFWSTGARLEILNVHNTSPSHWSIGENSP